MRSGRPRGVPAAVWAVTALHAALLVLYSLLYPPYLGPDEPQHVDMVVALRAGDGWPAPGERTLSQGVFVTSDPIYPQGDVEALPRPYRPEQFAPRGLRPSLEDAGGNAPSTGALPNQMVQHPPLYYAMGAAVLELAPDGLPYDRTLALLRLLSVALVAPLPLLCWGAGRLVSPAPVVGVAAAAFPLAVPGLTRIGAMAGNDSLMVLGGAAATVALLKVAKGDLSLRTAAAAGALVTLALLAKGFGLVFLPLLVAVYVVAAVRRSWAAAVRPALLAGALATVGAAWWVRNLVLYGAVQPRGFGPEATAELLGERRPPGAAADVGTFVDGFWRLVTTRFWAGLGVVEPPTFPVWLAGALAVAVLVLAAVALAVRRRGGSRLHLLVVSSPVALTLGLTLTASWSNYSAYGRDPGVQGRYLYGAVLGVAVLAAVGVGVLARRWAAAVVLAAALTLQLYALALVLDDFWALGDGVRSALAAVAYVAPWPAGVLAIVAVAVAVTAALSGWLSLRTSKSPRRQVEA